MDIMRQMAETGVEMLKKLFNSVKTIQKKQKRIEIMQD
jgi:hypothetical protein